MNKVEKLIKRFNEVRRQNLIKDVSLTEEFKTETIRDIIVREFNKRYYNI